jgi:hypothetical protein
MMASFRILSNELQDDINGKVFEHDIDSPVS